MIIARRVKRAFAFHHDGKVSPVGENIFHFNRRKILKKKRAALSKMKLPKPAEARLQKAGAL